jgi:ATP-dependent DNA helicase RecG
MKSAISNTSTKSKSKNSKTLSWSSPLEDLLSKNSTSTIEKLNSAKIFTLLDLLWVFPLRIVELPPTRSFSYLEQDKIFIGKAKVLNIQARPNFRARGKGRALLYNIVVYVKDLYSEQIITLKWFNCYSSVKDKISKCDLIEFLGTPTQFQNQWQITNSDFYPIANIDDPSHFSVVSNDLKIQYPTIKGIAGPNIKKIFDKIPNSLWDEIEESLPEKLLNEKKFLSLSNSFKVIHAKIKPNTELFEKTNQRLIYEEFFEGQLKIFLRRKFFKKPKAPSFKITDESFLKLSTFFPFAFTPDQTSTLNEIRNDLSMNSPMMRLVQGDVGCGKTWVAFMTSLIVIQNKAQVAMMCPTEALALQHYIEANELFEKNGIRVSLLFGSTSPKEKKIILEKLLSQEIDFIIGTHSLIQETVVFKNFGLAIIDEQHKFGVDQRIKLTSKGSGTHCLIMSATPIPRSLSLTQYGDLDISTIKSMPSGRKGHKTRIVKEDTFLQFLNFIKTRISLGEQVYVVVAAINENPEMDFHNLDCVLARFKKYFPEQNVSGLHGQLKSKEKEDVFKLFKENKIQILVSTSVIEVGINVPNATIMAIMNPERFGLSSLHQLRGRVGRGDKPGFCFLVVDKSLSNVAIERLKVIEQNTDGFKIAEEDLRIRGEGDLFGTDQSGSDDQKRFANIVTHADVLYSAKNDADRLIREENPEVMHLLEKFSKDERVFTTV